MTTSIYQTLARTVNTLIEEAKSKGLSVSNPIKLLLLGSTVQGDLAAPQRYVIISYATPVVYDEVQLWINPTNRMILKCDPFAKDWNQIYEYSDLMSPYNQIAGGTGGAGSGGTGTGQPVQSLTDLSTIVTSTIPDKTLTYVENERAIYAYDATSIDSGPGVIVPASGVGRWILVSNIYGTAVNLDGGVF